MNEKPPAEPLIEHEFVEGPHAVRADEQRACRADEDHCHFNVSATSIYRNCLQPRSAHRPEPSAWTPPHRDDCCKAAPEPAAASAKTCPRVDARDLAGEIMLMCGVLGVNFPNGRLHDRIEQKIQAALDARGDLSQVQTEAAMTATRRISDKERLDWLQRQGLYIYPSTVFYGQWRAGMSGTARGIRSVIDAAIRAERKHQWRNALVRAERAAKRGAKR